MRRAAFRFALVPLFALLTMVAAPSGAGAQSWTTDGKPLCDPFAGQGLVRLVSDVANGATFVWNDGRTLTAAIYANRLDVNGDPVAGWNANGVQVAARAVPIVYPQICPDGTGGAFVAFGQFGGPFGLDSLFLTRIQGNGTRGAGFALGGAFTGALNPNDWSLMYDGAGVYVMWRDADGIAYLQRMTTAGAVSAGWPAGGVTIGLPAGALPVLRGDGAGGVYVAYNGSDTLVVKRLTSAGATAAGWPADGFVPVDNSTFGRSSLRASSVVGTDLMLVWEEFEAGGDFGIRATRVTSAGARAAGWTASGLSVVNMTGDQSGPRMVSDDNGGVLIAWRDFRTGSEVYATRVNANGTLHGSWPAGGLLLSNPLATVNSFEMELDAQGGAVLAWIQDVAGEDFIVAQRVTGAGALAAGWSATGTAVCAATGFQDNVNVTVSGAGGAIVGWDDARTTPRVYAGRVDPNGIVSALASLVSAAAVDGRVSLDWYVADEPGVEAAIERSEAGGPWVERARLRPDGLGHVRWEDVSVAPGGVYAYRLRLFENGTSSTSGEVTVRVPLAARLALAGFRPNPPDRRGLVSFTLPAAAPARLAVLDIAGRRVLERELRGLAAGEHVIALPEIAALRAGLYFVTLEQAGARVSARLVRTD